MNEKYKCKGCGVYLKLSDYQDRKFDTETYFGKCPCCETYNEFKPQPQKSHL